MVWGVRGVKWSVWCFCSVHKRAFYYLIQPLLIMTPLLLPTTRVPDEHDPTAKYLIYVALGIIAFIILLCYYH